MKGVITMDKGKDFEKCYICRFEDEEEEQMSMQDCLLIALTLACAFGAGALVGIYLTH